MHGAIDPTKLPPFARFARTALKTVRQPELPPYSCLRDARLELGIVVNVHGRAEFVGVIEPSEYPKLDRVARTAILQAKFTPARLDGIPVKSCTILRMVFKIEDR